MSQQDDIIAYLRTKWSNGALTREIAGKFSLTNRQVGSIMGKLSRAGKVRTYTKGTIWIQHWPGSECGPMGLSNSYYEAID